MVVIPLQRAGLLYPTMLLVYMLLFSLLGTSVISLPVTPNDSPHSPLSSPVQQPEGLVTFHIHENGEEANMPISVPNSLRQSTDLPLLPKTTLSLNNIELYADRWYREPTNVSAILLTFNQISVYLT